MFSAPFSMAGGGDESSSDDDDAGALAGLSLPTFGAPAGGAQEEDDDDEQAPSPPQPAELGAEEKGEQDSEEEEEEEEAGPTGVSAEQAFASDTMDSLELDPFRRAAGADVPDREAEAKGEKGAKGMKGKKLGYVAQGHISQRKIFFGGLGPETTDASLLKAAVRYGKVQEAVVVRTDGGKSRGFGFVTYVSHKGANYVLKEAGDEGKIVVDGRQCGVRASEEKVKATEGLHKLPARGNLPQSKPEPRERRAPGGVLPESSYGGGEGSIGVSAIAGAHKRAPRDRDEEAEEGEARPKKAKKKKEEIVTVSRRQDAEPLDKRPITMKELFPKEFWRV